MNRDGDFPERFGFRSAAGGAHQARSMMLAEIASLFAVIPTEAVSMEYRAAVVDRNILSKKTLSNRRLTFRHLLAMYGLDPAFILFRAFRRLWDVDERGRPLLAFQYAFTREPLLRASAPAVLSKKPGYPVRAEEVESILESISEGAYSPVSLKSFARNIMSSWTQSGFLRGKVAKVRAHPCADASNAAFAAFTARLDGCRGEALFDNRWTALLDIDAEGMLRLIEAASGRGLVRLLRVGPVMELRFPGWLSEEEEAEADGKA